MSRVRVFIGLQEVAGFNSSLQRGLAELGVDCQLFDLDDNPYRYREAPASCFERLAWWATRKRVRTAKMNIPGKLLAIGGQAVARWSLFVWAVLRFDVFIVACTTFTKRHRELRLLKALGKKILVISYGSDFRPPFMNSKDVRSASVEELAVRTQRQREKVRFLESVADWIVCSPFQSHYLRKPFYNWFVTGVPVGEADSASSEQPEGRTVPQERAIRIVHAPSDPQGKGTSCIRAAISTLKRQGCRIDYVELVGVQNRIVLEELERCDFAVDQAYSDTLMAGFACEAARCGKPVVVGGYGWDELSTLVPPESLPPVEFCHPDRLVESIRRLVVDAEYREALGRRAREFVENNWSRRNVAERYLAIISSDAPREWLCDPARIKYVHGFGLREDVLRRVTAGLVGSCGAEALGVDDKPGLKAALLELRTPCSLSQKA